MKKQNPLDSYHEQVCENCDRLESCDEGSGIEIACILASILKKMEKKEA